MGRKRALLTERIYQAVQSLDRDNRMNIEQLHALTHIPISIVSHCVSNLYNAGFINRQRSFCLDNTRCNYAYYRKE